MTKATGNEEEKEKGEYIKEYKRGEHMEEEERIHYMKGLTRGRGKSCTVMSCFIKLSFNILFVTVLGGRRAL